MLIPRFSLRWVLAATFGCALVFLTGRMALAGHLWAIGIVSAIGLAAALFGIFAALFAIAFTLSTIAGFRSRPKLESPFATDKLPPQVIPPQPID